MWRTRLALAAVAAVGVAASPPACRAGLGSFQVNISEWTRLRRRDDTRRRRLDGVNHTHAVNHTTHKERVARHRREWKLRKTRKHAAAEQARAANATCYPRGRRLFRRGARQASARRPDPRSWAALLPLLNATLVPVPCADHVPAPTRGRTRGCRTGPRPVVVRGRRIS